MPFSLRMSAKFLSRKEIAKRFKGVRQANDWTQEELAELLGLPGSSGQTEVSKWERNERSIPNEHLERMAMLSGEPLAYFVLDQPSGSARPDDIVVAEWLEARAEELRRKVRPLPPSASRAGEAAKRAARDADHQKKRRDEVD